MIKHHPSYAVMKDFVSGNLTASVSVIVASHVEMCSECQLLVNQLTEVAALQSFGMAEDNPMLGESDLVLFEDLQTPMDVAPDNAVLAESVHSITSKAVIHNSTLPTTVTEVEVSGLRIALPRAIKSITSNEWSGVGKVSRSRLSLDDGKRHSSLLHIAAGGRIPLHTHKGFEITLVIQGSFEDEYGTFHAGDFIWLDEKHTHAPVTQEGCVCLTVSDDALYFIQGASRLFNPLGKLIY